MRNEEEEEEERVVPLKRFCKRLHKKNCFFPWELKLGEQSGRARCELLCGSIPTLLLLPLSQELFLRPPPPPPHSISGDAGAYIREEIPSLRGNCCP